MSVEASRKSIEAGSGGYSATKQTRSSGEATEKNRGDEEMGG